MWCYYYYIFFAHRSHNFFFFFFLQNSSDLLNLLESLKKVNEQFPISWSSDNDESLGSLWYGMFR